MKDDTDINNLNCIVSNDKLSYEEFTDFSFEKADACEWVVGDMSKFGKEDIHKKKRKILKLRATRTRRTM